MTLIKPYLFLNRLVVISHVGSVAYDQKFHRGVNIIRGQNSSGKSTVANFIFYSLGGDFNNWTTEAEKCREVFAEVEINEATLTLKRTVTNQSQQPMSIFWGTYEAAIKSNFAGWKTYPYRQTTNKESFSNVLLGILGFPEIRSADDNKITINQILRLIYIDQDSPTQNLFRAELFDQPITRQAISELLLGVYDDSLYRDRLALRDAGQKYQQKKEQFDGISKIFSSAGNEIDVSKIRQEMEKTRKRVSEEQEEIEKLRAKAYVNLRKNEPVRIEKLQKELGALKSKINHIASERKEFELDIVDSKQFIEVLEKRVSSLDSSILTRKVLGELPLEYCPQCLKPLGSVIEDNHCVLCKQTLDKGVEKTQARRLRQELDLQIKESKKLLEEKTQRLAELSSQLTPLLEQYRLKQREIDLEEKEARTTRDQRLDELLVSKGRLESHLNFLSKQISSAEQLELLRKELQELKQQMEELTQSIKLKESQQHARLRTAHERVEAIALSILRKDLARQQEFRTGNSVEVNFPRDSFSLDGNNNFSASSNTYLKNAVRFAIFFASLELPYFRYPRFILCDNMEDKGMEQVRTQHFQKVITEISQSYEVEHQIIFTTSMIDPTLNNETYGIGDEYTENHKSLRL